MSTTDYSYVSQQIKFVTPLQQSNKISKVLIKSQNKSQKRAIDSILDISIHVDEEKKRNISINRINNKKLLRSNFSPLSQKTIINKYNTKTKNKNRNEQYSKYYNIDFYEKDIKKNKNTLSEIEKINCLNFLALTLKNYGQDSSIYTFYLAVDILNIYVDKIGLNESEGIQKICLSCMIIASKVEDYLPISPSFFGDFQQFYYKNEFQIMKTINFQYFGTNYGKIMDRLILKYLQIEFQQNNTTIQNILHYFLKISLMNNLTVKYQKLNVCLAVLLLFLQQTKYPIQKKAIYNSHLINSNVNNFQDENKNLVLKIKSDNLKNWEEINFLYVENLLFVKKVQYSKFCQIFQSKQIEQYMYLN